MSKQDEEIPGRNITFEALFSTTAPLYHIRHIYSRNMKLTSTWSVQPDLTQSNIFIRYDVTLFGNPVTNDAKYIYKGPDRASVAVQSSRDINDDHGDEVKLYMDTRYICPSEAYARIMGWATHKVRTVIFTSFCHACLLIFL